MNYDKAARVIGCTRTKVWRYATRLGLARTERLDDVAIELIREAIERETRTKTGLQVSGTVDHDAKDPSRKSLKPFIIRRAPGEEVPLFPHFSVSRGGRFFKPAASISETPADSIRAQESTDQPLATEKPSADLIVAASRYALSELEAVIATRELELAALRRARAVLARDGR